MPPYEVSGPSQCLTLPHFRDHDGYPMRSPLVVADFLVEQLQMYGAMHTRTSQAGTALRVAQYAEVGTRDGDNVACVAQLARRAGLQVVATAIEQSSRRCQALRLRSAAAGDVFNVLETQVNETTHLQMLPTADVYYYWGLASTNIQMTRWIDAAFHAHGASGTFFLGYDWHYPADRSALATHVQALRSIKGNSSVALKRLFFDETHGREDMDPPPDEMWPIGASSSEEPGSPRKRPPSYTRPFAKRPGRWGVFHVVSVKLGVGTRTIPRELERHVARELE